MTTDFKIKSLKFDADTAKAMRLAVAQDVIDTLDRRFITRLYYYSVHPGNNVFNQIITDHPEQTSHSNFQRLLAENEDKCYVCALGSAFLSYVKLYDDVDGREFLNGPMSCIKQTLLRVFSREQMDLIESAFEMQYMGSSYHISKSDAVGFGYRIHNNKERLRAIMQNIIDNDGEFKPPAVG